MRKFANVRLPVLCALVLAAGIITGTIFYYFKISLFWLLLAALPFGAVILIALFIKNEREFYIACSILLFVLFLIGGINSANVMQNYDDYDGLEVGKEYVLDGTVKEKGKTQNGEYILIDNVRADGKRIGGKVYVYLSSTYGEFCDVGYTVHFSSTLEKLRSFEYGEINYRLEKNVRYETACFVGLTSTYHFNLFAHLKSSLKDMLQNNLSNETASISLAMLTGDTQDIERQSLENFRYGGIAHIFAVSGLHIGLIFALLEFILKKLHVNRYISAGIILFCIIFYSGFCGFNVSSVRAVVMCTVLIFARHIFQKYDNLNSLSIAAAFIMLVNPMSVYSIGFLLSVCSVGGILIFSNGISHFLRRIKIPKKIGSAIGVPLGAQLGAMPVMLSKFGYLSGVGLLLNLLVIPLLSTEYAIMFIAVIISAIIPPAAAVILPNAMLPLQLIFSFINAANFEKALITGFGGAAFLPLYLIFMLPLSDKLNLGVWKRLIALTLSVAVLTSYTMVKILSPFSGYEVIISSYIHGGEMLIKSRQGTLLIVTDDADGANLQKFLSENYVRQIDAIFIVGDEITNTLPELNIDCKNIYAGDLIPPYQPYGDIVVNFGVHYELCGIDFRFTGANMLGMDIDGVSFIFTNSAIASNASCDILITEYPTDSIVCIHEINFQNTGNTLTVYNCGDLIYSIDDGKFALKTPIPPRF